MQIYDQLWREAEQAFKAGEPQIDPNLADKSKDRRRCVTLLLRPSGQVQSRVKEFSDELAAAFPGQYFYRPEEFHVTVLSIISGSEFWRNEMRHLAAFRVMLRGILHRQRAFKLRFRGVTATPGTVLVQGFPVDDGLAKIRAEIRREFSRSGFGHTLDRRYTISAAHLTLMRFRQPEADWKQLAARLEANRQTDFGETTVAALQLNWGDWYASADMVRLLEEYRL